MDKGIKVILWLFCPLIGIFMLIFIIGIIVSINEPNNITKNTDIQANENQANNSSIIEKEEAPQSANEDKLECPKQGFFQSNWDYCIDLCLVGKSDATVNYNQCEKICDQTEYYEGSDGLIKRINDYGCKKCGKCNN